jgi:hypothetical protein
MPGMRMVEWILMQNDKTVAIDMFFFSMISRVARQLRVKQIFFPDLQEVLQWFFISSE